MRPIVTPSSIPLDGDIIASRSDVAAVCVVAAFITGVEVALDTLAIGNWHGCLFHGLLLLLLDTILGQNLHD
jgi:hypothetical protein